MQDCNHCSAYGVVMHTSKFLHGVIISSMHWTWQDPRKALTLRVSFMLQHLVKPPVVLNLPHRHLLNGETSPMPPRVTNNMWAIFAIFQIWGCVGLGVELAVVGGGGTVGVWCGGVFWSQMSFAVVVMGPNQLEICRQVDHCNIYLPA